MELCLSRRILLILKVNHVQNVCPWPFFAINALGLAIALSTVNHWQAFRLHLLSEAIRCRLSRDEHLRYSLLAQSWQHLVIIEVFEEHRRVHHRDRVDELCKALTELLDDFLPDYVELAVGDLLEGRSWIAPMEYPWGVRIPSGLPSHARPFKGDDRLRLLC